MPDLAHLTVLVVDDEEGVRRVLRRTLAGLGIDRVELAADVESAVSLLREGSTPCDVAFCDLQMPGGGSATLLRELAALRATPDIILMSGAGSAALDEAAKLAAELKLTVAGKLQKSAELVQGQVLDQRVDHGPAILHDQNLPQVHETGFGVDVDFGKLHAARTTRRQPLAPLTAHLKRG